MRSLVFGEIGIIAGAFADAGTRVASLIGVVWLVLAAACWLAFFSRRAPTGG